MISVLFPGQGSQYISMASDLAENYPVVKSTLEEAADVLAFDMLKLINEGPETQLNRTDLTQPAILAVSVAIWRLITATTELKADFMAGHSLGEYSALVCAGAISYQDALVLVNQRGKFMLEAVPVGTGAMSAILGLEDDLILKACQEAAGDEVVEPVNFNSPGQVVIAGHNAALERAGEACLKLGAKKVVPLAVSAPFHCSLMRPAAEKLAEKLHAVEIKTPAVSVLNNVDVKIQSDPTEIRDALIRQLYSPVRWSESMQWFEANSVTSYIECGPGKVLAGLIKRINRRSQVQVTTDVTSYQQLLETINA